MMLVLMEFWSGSASSVSLVRLDQITATSHDQKNPKGSRFGMMKSPGFLGKF